MSRKALVRAILVWFAILLVAILNGTLRDAVLANLVSPTTARLLSGVILCALILIAAILSANWIGRLPLRARWHVGTLWLLLTLGFELAVGYAQHQSWQRLLEAYQFQDGNLWPLVLVTTFVAPWLGARIRGLRP